MKTFKCAAGPKGQQRNVEEDLRRDHDNDDDGDDDDDDEVMMK
jgi:hypothetical protein